MPWECPWRLLLLLLPVVMLLLQRRLWVVHGVRPSQLLPSLFDSSGLSHSASPRWHLVRRALISSKGRLARRARAVLLRTGEPSHATG